MDRLSVATVSPRSGTTLQLIASDAGLLRLNFRPEEPSRDWLHDERHPILRATSDQLRAYFAGELREFDLPLDLRGTDFQRRVWAELQRIPYAQTRSYAELAHSVGSPNGFRAVGAANGKNPIGIIVPCHRVIASDGTLCGFGGGLPMKRLLLDLEASQVQKWLFAVNL